MNGPGLYGRKSSIPEGATVSLSTRTLALASVACLAVFPVIVVALNLVQGSDYSARLQAMSELALGRDGWLMFLAFISMGAGMLALALVMRREFPKAWTTFLALVVAAALDVVSAFFHANRTGEPATMTSNVHQSAGILTFVLAVIAMLASVRHLHRSPSWRRFTVPTICWSGAAIATFFLIPVLGDANFGIAQRVFVASWLSWMITTALIAYRVSARSGTRGSTEQGDAHGRDDGERGIRNPGAERGDVPGEEQRQRPQRDPYEV